MTDQPTIAEITRRAEKATEGPWTTDKPRIGEHGYPEMSMIAATAPRQGVFAKAERGIFPANDREFIAHARSDIPWLLGQLAAAQAEIGRLSKTCEEAAAEITRLRAALAAAEARAVPEGWKMVPWKRDPGMVDASRTHHGEPYVTEKQWEAMLSAAPQPPQSGGWQIPAIPVLNVPVARLMEIDQASVFALADIAAERVRQIDREEWDCSHDDRHESGTLAKAAAAYALVGRGGTKPAFWPWDAEWWRPKSPHRNYVRAGALLVAELARHLRSTPQPAPAGKE